MERASVERSGRDPATVAREIVDANPYMTLATADVTGPAALRLYRARASAHFVLGVNDERLAVRLG
jgi:hypothetical protein